MKKNDHIRQHDTTQLLIAILGLMQALNLFQRLFWIHIILAVLFNTFKAYREDK